jgi:hypothetical protein
MLPLTHDPATMLFLLLAGHAIADYPLQGSFLAEGKNRHTTLGREYWPHALAAHAVIHGGFVVAVTGSAALGIAETVAHGITDWMKCEAISASTRTRRSTSRAKSYGSASQLRQVFSHRTLGQPFVCLHGADERRDGR